MFEDLPAKFSPDDVERALAVAAETPLADEDTLQSLGQKLVDKGTEVRSDEDAAGLLVIIDGLVCQLYLGDVAQDHWGGIPLGPRWEMGGSAFPPYVSSFPTSVLTYIERRAGAAERDDVKARHYDFLWCHRRGYLDAQGAIRAYRRAGVGSDPLDATDHMTAARHLTRAAELSMAINFERTETAEVLIREIRAAIHEEGGGFVWQLAHALGRLAQELPDLAGELLDELLGEAERSIGNVDHEKTVLEAAEAIADALGRREAVELARRRIAEACEREAVDRQAEGGLIQVALLRDAIQAYERVGDGDAIQRLKDRLADAAVQAGSELNEIGVEVKVPNDVIKRAHDEATKQIDASEEGLLRAPLILGIWPHWGRVRERFAESRREHPLQWLGSRFTLGTEGRVSGPPPSEAEREEAYLLDYFSHEFQMTAGLSIHAVKTLRSNGRWSVEALVASLRRADNELASAAESGIQAHEAGDYWSAAHVLVPQFERGLRKLAIQLSADVRRLVRDQGIQVATLGPILADETVANFLGQDAVRTFGAVFVEPRGLNVRNNTAHGLLDPSEDQAAAAFIALMGVLTAGYLLLRLRTAAQATEPGQDEANSDEPQAGDEKAPGEDPPSSVRRPGL